MLIDFFAYRFNYYDEAAVITVFYKNRPSQSIFVSQIAGWNLWVLSQNDVTNEIKYIALKTKPVILKHSSSMIMIKKSCESRNFGGYYHKETL